MTRRYLATTFSIAVAGALAIAACSTDDGGGATVCTEVTLCRFLIIRRGNRKSKYGDSKSCGWVCRDTLQPYAEVGEMPTVEGREARVWIDEYVNKAGKLSGVAKMVRALVKKAVAGCEEYVNPWKIPTFDLNGPLCFYMATKEHVIFGFMRGAMLRDPGKLLEGTGKYLRHVKLRSAADVRRSEVRALLEQAAKLNRKEPVTGTKVQMKQSRAAGTRKNGRRATTPD